MGRVVHITPPNAPSAGRETAVQNAPQQIFFTRHEFDSILRVYALMVASGDWRDYGLETSEHSVAFAVYKRAHDLPIYRIEKRPKAKKNGPYFLSEPGGLIRCGRDLDHILAYFKAKKSFFIAE